MRHLTVLSTLILSLLVAATAQAANRTSATAALDAAFLRLLASDNNSIQMSLYDIDDKLTECQALRVTLDESLYLQYQLDEMDDRIQDLSDLYNSVDVSAGLCDTFYGYASDHYDAAESWWNIGDWFKCEDECGYCHDDLDSFDTNETTFWANYSDPGQLYDDFMDEYNNPMGGMYP